MVCERLGQKVCEEQISVVMMQQKPDAVVSELFSSVCAEIRDEVCFSASALKVNFKPFNLCLVHL